jgi:hypothetical protein
MAAFTHDHTRERFVYAYQAYLHFGQDPAPAIRPVVRRDYPRDTPEIAMLSLRNTRASVHAAQSSGERSH